MASKLTMDSIDVIFSMLWMLKQPNHYEYSKCDKIQLRLHPSGTVELVANKGAHCLLGHCEIQDPCRCHLKRFWILAMRWQSKHTNHGNRAQAHLELQEHAGCYFIALHALGKVRQNKHPTSRGPRSLWVLFKKNLSVMRMHSQSKHAKHRKCHDFHGRNSPCF